MNPIFHRTSIRKYLPAPIEAEKVEYLLRAAMAAPSACNQQPWEFYVVTDPEKIRQLSQTSPYAKCAAGAPLVFVPCYRTEVIAPSYCEIDMSASVENLLLAADEQELGCVWMGIAPIKDRMEAVRKVLDVPEHLQVFCLIACGYPAEKKQQQERYDTERVHDIR